MKVDMPSEEEIRIEIDNIIAKGIEKRESFYSYLKNMYRQIGFRYLFHDGIEIIFTILLVSSILLSVVKGNDIHYKENIELIYVYLFTVSPILYLAMSVVSFVTVKENKTYEIEMTCKHNIYQIVAFKMLIFSTICILINFFFVYTITYFYESLSFIKAFIISIASLFLFSTIFLFTLTKLKNRFIKYFIILGWLGLNLALYMFEVDFYVNLLNNISMYTWLVVTIGSIFIYIKNLKTLTIFRYKEGMI